MMLETFGRERRGEERRVAPMGTYDGLERRVGPRRNGIESRRHRRVEANTDKPEQLYICNDEIPTTHATVINISQRGVGFLFDEQLNINDHCKVALVVPETGRVVLCTGTVRFIENFVGVLGYGVELAPHPDDETALANYIATRWHEA